MDCAGQVSKALSTQQGRNFSFLGAHNICVSGTLIVLIIYRPLTPLEGPDKEGASDSDERSWPLPPAASAPAASTRFPGGGMPGAHKRMFRVCVFVCMLRVCVRVCVHMGVCALAYAYACAYVCFCVPGSVCTCICIRVCVCV